jgi:hypothetical protein
MMQMTICRPIMDSNGIRDVEGSGSVLFQHQKAVEPN